MSYSKTRKVYATNADGSTKDTGYSNVEKVHIVNADELGGGGEIEDGAVTSTKIADGAVTTAKIATDAKAPFAGTADKADNVPWTGVNGKPAEYKPEAHTHVITDVSNLQTELNRKINKTATDAIDGIPDPSTATTEDIANKVNEILTALKG